MPRATTRHSMIACPGFGRSSDDRPRSGQNPDKRTRVGGRCGAPAPRRATPAVDRRARRSPRQPQRHRPRARQGAQPDPARAPRRRHRSGSVSRSVSQARAWPMDPAMGGTGACYRHAMQRRDLAGMRQATGDLAERNPREGRACAPEGRVRWMATCLQVQRQYRTDPSGCDPGRRSYPPRRRSRNRGDRSSWSQARAHLRDARMNVYV